MSIGPCLDVTANDKLSDTTVGRWMDGGLAKDPKIFQNQDWMVNLVNVAVPTWKISSAILLWSEAVMKFIIFCGSFEKFGNSFNANRDKVASKLSYWS